MKSQRSSRAGLGALAFLVLNTPAAAHSWIERAYRIAANGSFVGPEGFPRGYVARDAPGFTDAAAVQLMPAQGQNAYSGSEVLNKYPFSANPEHPMLEAAAGDYIALLHLENGHTTLPQNQPMKPRNRGTVYFYGTSEPMDQEKLFDVHLLWNEDGTGGDGRGRLLATRNYDDGQCFQPNSSPLSSERSSVPSANPTQELACQSDLKLPDDLAPGSIYTIYWYWDWPDLNPQAIDIEATTNGQYPWAGTFMRGEEDPHGFTMEAIARNESYSSTIDIKIGEASPSTAQGFVNKMADSYVAGQDIYSVAILEQLSGNYQVDVGGNGNNNGGDTPSTSAVEPPPIQPSSTGGDGGGVTVTVTETVPPTTVATTVYITVTGPESPDTQPTNVLESSAEPAPTDIPSAPASNLPGAQPTGSQSSEAPYDTTSTQPVDTASTAPVVQPTEIASNPAEPQPTSAPPQPTPQSSTTPESPATRSYTGTTIQTIVTTVQPVATPAAAFVPPRQHEHPAVSGEAPASISVAAPLRALRRDWTFGRL